MKSNFYRLTKKELSLLTSVEAPVVLSRFGTRLSRPVVIGTSKLTGKVCFVWTLRWFRSRVKIGCPTLREFDFSIFSMY